MKIKQMIVSPGRTGFFFDDYQAIRDGGAKADGANYVGSPMTPGFQRVRQAGESISIQFILDDGQIAWGDCAAVQYSGAGGRDPLFLAAEFIPVLEKSVAPLFIDHEITTFKQMAEEVENVKHNGKPLHTALRYGLTQAVLDAVSKKNRELMCETIAREYGTKVSDKMIAIFTQSGDARYDNADKMIIKGSDILPHALINNVEEKLGKNGEILEKYLVWLKNRIIEIRVNENYAPIIHIDVYGTIGKAFGYDNYDAICDYFERLVKAIHPFKLRIEGPIDAGTHELTVKHLAGLTKMVDDRKINIELVADEWCNTLADVKEFADKRAGHMIQIKTPDLGGIHNTIEAVLYCKSKDIGSYQGGTCNETDRSAVVSVHIAMATNPVQVLAKPGMGVDEGFMIVYNEMQRILAYRKAVRK